MRILFVYGLGNAELLNRKSALGSYMHCLCTLLKSDGHEIYFNDLAFSEFENSQSSSSSQSFQPGRRRVPIPGQIKNFLKNYRKLNQIRKLKQRISRIEFHPEIIIEFYNYGSNLGTNLSERFGCPLALIYDAPVLEEFEFFNGRSTFFRGIITAREKTALKKAGKVVVYSNAVMDFLIQKYGLDKSVFRIHQNVDFTRFDFLEPKPYPTELHIGFIGSFLSWHRVDILLEGFESIFLKGINARLYLIGSGLEFEVIKSKVSRLRSASKITLTGFLDGKELSDVKSGLHIGVMPGSNWYGAPNKIFEYGAAGMAVVAPDTPTISSLFTSKEIAFFKWDDAKDFSEVLENLVTDRNLYSSLAMNLSSKIRASYSEKQTIRFYNELISVNPTINSL